MPNQINTGGDVSAAERAWDPSRIYDWQLRSLNLWAALRPKLGEMVKPEAVEWILGALISPNNPACCDASNAAHIMAQNDNLIVLAQWIKASPEVFSIALMAGFIHDLNKAKDEPLRTDEYAVLTRSGQKMLLMTSDAQVVGLNHYGQRTFSALKDAQARGLLSEMVRVGIDRCILHHGLGSSRFIQSLVQGKLGYGQDDYLDADGQPRLCLPPQPPASLATVLHDLADSVQQMQAGVAWVKKYPLGYWRQSQSSWADLLSGDTVDGKMPTGLIGQLRTELATCRGILSESVKRHIISNAQALRLERGVRALVDSGRAWVDNRSEVFELTGGQTVYHQMGSIWGVSPKKAEERLKAIRPGESTELDVHIVSVARVLDNVRIQQLRDSVLDS